MQGYLLRKNAGGKMRYFAGELEFLQEDSKGGLILPDGASVNKIYICGALTELKNIQNGRGLNARVADPTGVFKISCGKDLAYCSSVFMGMGIPVFVLVYGKVLASKRYGTFEIDIIPESVCEISRKERDLWVLGTAAATIKRLENSFESIDADYGREVVRIVNEALLVAAPCNSCETIYPVDILEEAGERIMAIIAENSSKKGVLLDDLYSLCENIGIEKTDVHNCLKELIEDGELYLPSGGYVKIL